MIAQAEGGLVTLTDPRSSVAEAFRTLRTNLEFFSLDNPVRTLVVTSAGPGEGKSTTLANLAITTAQTEKKVYLVDCDLRRPVLHQLFGMSTVIGLITVFVMTPPLQSSPAGNAGTGAVVAPQRTFTTQPFRAARVKTDGRNHRQIEG